LALKLTNTQHPSPYPKLRRRQWRCRGRCACSHAGAESRINRHHHRRCPPSRRTIRRVSSDSLDVLLRRVFARCRGRSCATTAVCSAGEDTSLKPWFAWKPFLERPTTLTHV